MNYYLAKARVEKKVFPNSSGVVDSDMRLIMAVNIEHARLKYLMWVEDFNKKTNFHYILHDIEIVETIL
jgi:hypothetical protein